MRSEVEVNLMNVDLCSVSGVGGWKIHVACETKHQRSFPEILCQTKTKLLFHVTSVRDAEGR